jgi:hypothetical protein
MSREHLITGVSDIGPRGFNAPLMSIGNPAVGDHIQAINQRLADGFSSWRSDAVERRDGSTIEGRGLFATEDIEASTVVAIKGGRVANEDFVRRMTAEGVLHGSQQQIGMNRFLVGLTTEEENENLVGYNHSCDANAFVVIPDSPERPQPIAFLVSRRNIDAGEEVTADYSVSNVSNTHRLFCNCGAEGCRKLIQPRYDYLLRPDFQAEHMEEFPRYIQEMILDLGRLPEEIRRGVIGSAQINAEAGAIILLSDVCNERTGAILLDAQEAVTRKRRVASRSFAIAKEVVRLQAADEQLREASQALAFGAMKFLVDLRTLFGSDFLASEGIALPARPSTAQVKANLEPAIELARRYDAVHGWIIDVT